MVKNLCKTPESATSEEPEQTGSRNSGCRAFTKLKTWQVRQYRIAVDENKWYMGERLGRDIPWKDAERDFMLNEYYGCAPKWRKEFCTSLCNHFSNCNLGKKFIRK
jgi:hypothetical protein